MQFQRSLVGPSQVISFDEMFSLEFPAIHRYARRRVGADVADDIAAETFTIAFARWDRFDLGRPVRPWLFGIATNVLRRYRRDEERKLRAFARSGTDPIAVESEDELLRRADDPLMLRELATLLAGLRVEDREILLLRAWAELSDEEIATALSVPVGTVKSRLHRIRERLRPLVTLSHPAPSGRSHENRKERR